MTGNGRPRQQFGYVPALDGVRALAVVAVICFHAGLGGASGGFIGVSVFFTLSGFLITSLLIAEHNHGGQISLKGFYARRVRRLLPASLTCIGLVLAAVPFWSDSQRRRLPGDALAALGNVFNWRAAASTVSYRDLFTSEPSPLAHFWSLAIEEQCYLVLPVIVVWSLRRGRSRLAATALMLLALSVISALLTSDFDIAYNGTHVRIAEVLVGMLLSVVITYRRPSGIPVQITGAVGLALLVAGTITLDIHDQWLAHGGLVLVALATGAVIVGSIADGPVAWVLALRPLVAIGKVSYGLYLFHWPIFLIVDHQRTGLGRWPLLAVRISLVAVLSYLSFRLLERPVRERRLLRRPVVAAVSFASAVAVLVGVAFVLPTPSLSTTEQLLEHVNDGQISFEEARPTVLVVGSDPAAVAALASGSVDVQVVDSVDPDCPVQPGVEVQLPDGSRKAIDQCVRSADFWLRRIAEVHPDVVVVSLGGMDDGLVRTAPSAVYPDPNDAVAVLNEYQAAGVAIAAALQQVASSGVPIVLYWGEPATSSAPLDWHVSVALGGGVDLAVTPDELATLTRQGLAAVASAAPRVLVIGDSTSLPFAVALDHAAAGTVQILWAGHGGCPFVLVDAVRAADGGWKDLHCDDYSSKLPGIVATFHPDAILLVAGGMELIEQRYPGDPAGYIAGSVGYQARHDAQMTDLLAVLGPHGPRVIVADSPPIAPGGFSSIEMSDAGRLAAWNAQIQRWAAEHSQVTVLPYTDALLAYEAQHGTIRKDGSHPEVEPLTEIMRVTLLPRLVALMQPPPG